VIVESPAKAKTINKYLGSDYIVKSSVGHVRDLPTGGSSKTAEKKPASRAKLTEAQKAEKAQSALVNRMGVDPEHGWKAHYRRSMKSTSQRIWTVKGKRLPGI